MIERKRRKKVKATEMITNRDNYISVQDNNEEMQVQLSKSILKTKMETNRS